MEKVHQSMVKPALLAGGHPRLTIINAVCCLAIISTGLSWWTLGLSAGIWSMAQWLLRAGAKRDPQWPLIYWRHLSEPRIRLPHGAGHAVPEAPKPLLPPAPRWMP